MTRSIIAVALIVMGLCIWSYAKASDEGQHQTVRPDVGLAKAGDIKQMQLYWCRAIGEVSTPSEDPSPQRVLDLAFIGGWYGVQSLDRLLSAQGAAHWARARRNHLRRDPYAAQNDAPDRPLQYLVVRALEGLVPEQPVKLRVLGDDMPEIDRIGSLWRKWIAEHRNELKTLTPTGEGVNFSDNACNVDGSVRTKP